MHTKTHPAHVKHIDTVGPFAVWLVDGEYIRKELNENFVKFDHHAHFSFIPTHELWIDQETNFQEHALFTNHFLAERALLDSGVTESQAHEAANTLEHYARLKTFAAEFAQFKRDKKALLARIKKMPLPEYSNEAVTTWIIDGKLVRDFFLIEYAEGGHDRVYTFVPPGEIWIEEVLSETERKFIVLHELHERYLMGEGKNYPHAHHGATIVEDHYRDHPDELDTRIREELAKQGV